MILVNRNPEQTTPNQSVKSKWNAVHNSAVFGLLRRDVTGFVTINYNNGTLGIILPNTTAVSYQLYDKLYVSAPYDVVCEIRDLTPSVGGTTFTLIVTDSAFVSGLPQYMNLLTRKEGYYAEMRVTTINSLTNKKTTHESARIYPSKNGQIYFNAHGFCLRELNKTNKNQYAFANWNDRYAWTTYYVEYRERYINESYAPVYSALEGTPATASGYAGQEIINHDFSSSSFGWTTTGFAFYQTTSIVVSQQSQVPYVNSNITPSYTISTGLTAGETYQGIIDVDLFGTNATLKEILVYDDASTMNVLFSTHISGIQTFTFTATANNIKPFVSFNGYAYGKLRKFSLQKFFSYEYLANPKYYFATNSVRQIQSEKLQNLAPYVCALSVIPTPADRPKFISDFDMPTKFKNYPFDISIIFHENMLNASAEIKEQIFDFNNSSLGVNDFAVVDYSHGEHRIKISSTYLDTDKFADVWIEASDPLAKLYVDDNYVNDNYVEDFTNLDPSYPLGAELTERRRIKLNNKCVDNPIYLAWKGREGGMNYWLFSKTQTIGSTIGEVQKFEPFNLDLNINGRSSVLTKTDKPTIVLGADQIDTNDIKGLMGLTASNFVQMYIGTKPKVGHTWQTVNVKEGSFKYYETENTKHEIELTIELVEKYVHLL